jgi:zinc protease
MKFQASSSLNLEALPGPHDISRYQLPNGIVLLVRPNLNSLSVSIAGYLQAGSLYDPEEQLGLADFTTSMLMRGTATRDFQQIYNTLESLGANLGLSCGAHTAGFGGKSLSSDLPSLLDILADALLNPVFPADHVKRVRSQLLTGLDLRSQDTSDMASLGFDQIAYKNHPYRFPSDGYPETIQEIHQEDLIQFHQNHYGPTGMVVAIVGQVKPDDALNLVQEHFLDWSNPDQPETFQVPPAAGLEKTVQKHHTIEEKSQSDIVLGVVGPPRKSGDFYPALLGNSVLGQFGMMGRIGESVRKQAGLAYYAYSSLSSSIGPGPWTVAAGVDPSNLERALELIKTEINNFISKPVGTDELSDVQSNYIGKLPLSLESNAGVAGALLTIERHQLGLDYFQNYQQMVQEITQEQILEAARKYLDLDRLAISTAGSQS